MKLTGAVVLEGAERFPHARRKLGAAFPGMDWRSGGDGLPRIRLVEDASLVEGAFSVVAADSAGPPVVTVRGGPFSGVIHGVNALIHSGNAGAHALDLSRLPLSEAPGLAYRTFWTWDHSTNWELSQVGHQEIGVFNPYGKPPKGFLADYTRLVDFCSDNRIAAVVIYGFLRDSHGGIEAAKELCRYATERGVRILPGVAIGAYGGIYWEGRHRYNLSTWLEQNPGAAASLEKGVGFQLEDLAFPLNFPRSDYTRSACPSAPETLDWMEEGISWLCETFDVGGVNIESGDYGVCGCNRCLARRRDREEAKRRAADHGESWSHVDMADNFPRLFKAARAKRPDAWVYCELQWDNLLDPAAHHGLEALPPGGVYQHTANRSYWRRLQRDLTRGFVEALPTTPNVLRCQFACQWNGDERTERYALNVQTFHDMAKAAHATGMQGLTVWGEPSPYHATVEASYLAFARFTWDPSLTLDRFIDGELGALLGGPEAARRFVAIASEIDANQTLPVKRLDELWCEAREHGRGDAASALRWLSLEDRIARRRFMGS